MKVLYIINNLGSGGAEKLIEELLPLMNKERSLEADALLLTDKNNVFYDSLIDKKVKVDIIKYKNLYDLRNILEIKKHIEKGKYDIVHVHLFPSLYWVAAVSKLINKNRPKFIYTEHSTHNRRREKKFFKKIDKFVYSQYDTIISIAEQTQKNLIDWIQPNKSELGKFKVIENGVDLSKIEKALPYKKSELIEGVSEDTKLVCMVGRFSEAKDQPTLIKSMVELPKNIHLVLVGEGTLLPENRELARSLGIEDRVHFLGFRQDVPKILKMVDIVVLSSYWEGLSLASIEGLASGKPFIASRVQGLEEIVDGYGLLFERGNHIELAGIILKIINNNVLCRDIKIKCLERANHYTIKTMLEKTIKLYLK